MPEDPPRTLTALDDTVEDRGASRPAPRDVIGRYTIDGKLGEGGMGLVYLGHDTVLKRNVALKVLRSRSDRARARLLREAQAAAQLAHPNVITVHEVGQDRDRVFIAMEYVDGGNLGEWLVHEPRSVDAILDMFAGAAAALSAAHAMGLVHRDFKPENCLVFHDGRLRVSDFGLVGVDAGTTQTHDVDADSLTRTGAIMGTPRYMAPEQHAGEVVDARADQFAFAVSLWEALYGAPPFDGDSYEELAANVAAGAIRPPRAPRRVPDAIEAALRRALSIDRADRFESIDDLVAALTAARGGRRRRWRTAVAVGVAAVAASGLAIAITRSPKPSTPSPSRSERAPPVERRLTSFGSDESLTDLAISPDATTLAFSGRGDVWIRDAEGRVRRLSHPGVEMLKVCDFYPDGRRILLWTGLAFVAHDLGDGSWHPITQVWEPLRHTLLGRIAPAGDPIAIVADRRIYLYRASTDASTLVYDGEGIVRDLSWAPDGHRFAFLEDRDGDTAMRIVALEDPTPVTRLASRNLKLSWGNTAITWLEPNRIIYATAGEAPSSTELWEINTDGPPTPVRRFAWSKASIRQLRSARAADTVAYLRTDANRNVSVARISDNELIDERPLVVGASADEPVGWLDDDTPLFISDRHGDVGVFAKDEAGKVIRVLPPGARMVAQRRDVVVVEHDGRWERRSLSDESITTIEPTVEPPPSTSYRCNGARDPVCVFVDTTSDAWRIRHLDFDRLEPGDVLYTSAASDTTEWALSPKGDALAILQDDETVVVVSLASGTRRVMYENPNRGYLHALAWSPRDDGTLYLAGMRFEAAPKGHLFGLLEISADGTTRLLWSDPERWLSGVIPSPDGKQLALGVVERPSDVWSLEGL